MRFLLDADLSPRLGRLFAEHGHDALHVETIFPPRTTDVVVAAFARESGRCLVTGDFDFADIREFPPRLYPGIVVLTLPADAGPPYIRSLTREFLERFPYLGDLRGKLLIVEPNRIRVRES